jgi:hypothetical protein
MINAMDVTFIGTKHRPGWRFPRARYRPTLAVLLLPTLLLMGVLSYYPAVRSLIGGFLAG